MLLIPDSLGDSRLPQILVEPGDHLVDAIGLALRVHEEMAFAGIDNELRRDVERSERVPEFIGLPRDILRRVPRQ